MPLATPHLIQECRQALSLYDKFLCVEYARLNVQGIHRPRSTCAYANTCVYIRFSVHSEICKSNDITIQPKYVRHSCILEPLLLKLPSRPRARVDPLHHDSETLIIVLPMTSLSRLPVESSMSSRESIPVSEIAKET